MTAKLLLTGALGLGLLNAVLFARAQDRMGRAGPPPCRSSIQYRIGTVDPRFGLTREDFQHYVEDASKLWGAGAGRHLFAYDGRGPLQIDLVYDSRQEATQRLIAARAAITEKLKELDSIKERLLPLQDRFRALDDTYSSQLASFQHRQQEYNKTVAQSDAGGGASEGEYQRLRAERLTLRKQADGLEAQRQELNRLTGAINALVGQHNELAHRANAEANALSGEGASGIEFEEGHYSKRAGEERIEIFQYESEMALRVILSHELGHALGIRHNANPSSIMSPLIHTRSLVLTADDIDGLRTACSLH